MEKIELEIITLSQNAAQNHSYAIILGEAGGVRRLPIVIGAFEAQAIAVAIEKVTPSRPLTHDLIRNTLQSFEITLKEVLIDNLQEGVFYAKLICQQKDEVIEIDSRTSDAIALAVRFNCPIYTYENILNQAGIVMDGLTHASSENKIKENKAPQKANKPLPQKDDLTSLTMEQLNERLQQYLENEEYEKAAAVRDELTKRE
jgi:bifunctional DNase/RNase